MTASQQTKLQDMEKEIGNLDSKHRLRAICMKMQKAKMAMCYRTWHMFNVRLREAEALLQLKEREREMNKLAGSVGDIESALAEKEARAGNLEATLSSINEAHSGELEKLRVQLESDLQHRNDDELSTVLGSAHC